MSVGPSSAARLTSVGPQPWLLRPAALPWALTFSLLSRSMISGANIIVYRRPSGSLNTGAPVYSHGLSLPGGPQPGGRLRTSPLESSGPDRPGLPLMLGWSAGRGRNTVYFSQGRVDPCDDRFVYVLGVRRT